jgi:hypothetical protein
VVKRIARMSLLIGSAFAALAIAQPAMAYTELGTTGTTGAHKLTDTSSSPGVICEYKYSASDELSKLKHIDVLPPKVKGITGHGNEQVAWRFIVQRQISGFGGPGPWKNRYTSPKWFATTDSAHNAPFLDEGVNVTVPFDSGGDAVAVYRVIVKAFWYDAHGNVIGTATMRDDWYRSVQPPDQAVTRHHECYDYETWT